MPLSMASPAPSLSSLIFSESNQSGPSSFKLKDLGDPDESPDKSAGEEDGGRWPAGLGVFSSASLSAFCFKLQMKRRFHWSVRTAPLSFACKLSVPPFSHLSNSTLTSCGGGDVERKNIHFPWDVLLCSLEMNLMNHLRGSQAPALVPLSPSKQRRSQLSTGETNTFTINCSGFYQHGVDPAAFRAIFNQKAFCPVINSSLPAHVNISFTLSAILEVTRWPLGTIALGAFLSPKSLKATPLLKAASSDLGFVWRGFLLAIDALSFYLPAESANRAPFEATIQLGCNIFLRMVNTLLPASPASYPHPRCLLRLSLMVGNLLETVFITYQLHVATTQPPPLPRWLHSLLLHCTSPGRCCPTAPQKGNKSLGLTPTHLPGPKELGELAGKELRPRETKLDGGSGWTKAQLVELWVQFSHAMDTLLFCLWNT
ncbi:PREDICTED: 5-hydroxytryptamine receptor 3C-like [Mandrillus leucophaeus]|uniref:5-hydroxytryptamine receptor 3C-like n=1 Tax=Mandrillus leucophaeus TaxID=9568 RepID=UPI0005F3FFA9|nr:PREDICTED: 5-hydroxytryptamine receptor 3C-like [Mandrillus leucophaeus]